MSDQPQPHQYSEHELAVIEGVFDLARGGRTSELLEMLDSGFPLDLANARGDTLLIVAAYAEQPGTVGALIERGAAIDAENAMGQTALSCAAFRGNAEIAQTLLDAGADPEAGHQPALAIARQFGRAEIETLLLER
ncbi:ankyrin repeat domain-containing protein [Ruicaihuangia caeni]|uniref:Ankyrin repeat domain-containing protein n=1 Tax=Ruicaihuangia caeni TaxID=3042517 RepID=A0AAW6T349_9MICO|nr:ankyrin repeat domain-containing protein [Klugiella sp. YN-L-19]MDI2097749.1 ankyrin repeat domain-containing protein [Klugiella sp. YN-L-19]